MPNKAPIPDQWRAQVCRILQQRAPNTINVTKRARNDWEATFPSAFITDLYIALEDTLSMEGAMGIAHQMNEPGETYAFDFEFEQRKMYAKVLLTPSAISIKIISAHRHLK